MSQECLWIGFRVSPNSCLEMTMLVKKNTFLRVKESLAPLMLNTEKCVFARICIYLQGAAVRILKSCLQTFTVWLLLSFWTGKMKQVWILSSKILWTNKSKFITHCLAINTISSVYIVNRRWNFNKWQNFSKHSFKELQQVQWMFLV